MSYLHDVCKDCIKRTEDCHATCKEYNREVKKHRFIQRWAYEKSLPSRYGSGSIYVAKTRSIKKEQRKQRYHSRNGK